MPTAIPECPACRVRLEEGFVAQTGREGTKLLSWTEGQPESGFFGGVKTRGRRRFDLGAFRCPRCGWVIWFAPEKAADER